MPLRSPAARELGVRVRVGIPFARAARVSPSGGPLATLPILAGTPGRAHGLHAVALMLFEPIPPRALSA